MIVRAIDGRFLGHPFFFSIEKERPWQRLSPASKHIQSEFFIHLCRAPPLSGCLCWAPALSVSGPGALCVGAWRSLCRGLALSVSGPGALCVRPWCSLCRALALSVSGPGALCVGPVLSVSGPGALCRAVVLSVSGPGTLVSGPASNSLALWARARSSDPGLHQHLTHPLRDPQLRSTSGPFPRSGRLSVCGPHTHPACSPRATHPVRGSDPLSPMRFPRSGRPFGLRGLTHPARALGSDPPFLQEKTPNLAVWDIIEKNICTHIWYPPSPTSQVPQLGGVPAGGRNTLLYSALRCSTLLHSALSYSTLSLRLNLTIML